MDELVTAVLRIVKEEIDLYRELTTHARAKTALLVRGRLDAILESNRVDESFNLKLRTLEDEMSRLTIQICRMLQIPREKFTLLGLAERSDPSTAEEIRSLATLFRNLISQLKKVNQRNMRLIESSLHISRGLIDFVSNATSSYQESGLLKPYSGSQSTMSSRA